ncbi:hypothetical protein L873DRAFT_1800270 [Choiromyces venosus 120613-1]|uniref:Uncharacterized protein n=1 Tax=Choiromyces venosus 120613-1 TaxID=1336337 RepID=A0A3N4JZP1_9PEZI|nr:hypothetical protein L873DRAFT_1800270 [Choiromyces venosus 120613-1]
MSFLRRTGATILTKSFKCNRKPPQFIRCVSTLENNPDIYIFPSTTNTHILSFLPTTPPNTSLSIGTTTTLPPTPDSFSTNPNFLTLLHETLRKHAHNCPEVQASAATYASPGGSSIFAARRTRGGGIAVSRDGSGAGGANIQGGVGGGGVGGFVHVCDLRNPPPFGRVGDPGDIIGSVQVDGMGRVIEGRYEPCGAYRVVTNDGILGLSDYLRGKLVERLKEEERKG